MNLGRGRQFHSSPPGAKLPSYATALQVLLFLVHLFLLSFPLGIPFAQPMSAVAGLRAELKAMIDRPINVFSSQAIITKSCLTLTYCTWGLARVTRWGRLLGGLVVIGVMTNLWVSRDVVLDVLY